MSKRCPTCKQAIPDQRKKDRVCVLCKKPIATHHKWYLADWKGGTAMRHRNCDVPEAYVPDLACAGVKAMRKERRPSHD